MKQILLWLAMIGLNNRQPPDALPKPAQPSVRLTAELISPNDVRLTWRSPDRRAAGHIVEFASQLEGEYVIIAFCPSHLATFTHERLAPETAYFYRVRAFHGPTTEPVAVKLPDDLSDADYVAAYAKPENYDWAAPARIADPGRKTEMPVKRSIRNAIHIADGAPSDLKAMFVPTTVSGFLLTWNDHASDEDGFLLEKVLDGGRSFRVCAYVPSDSNSFGWAFEPPARAGSFRIRAFYFGSPSNTVKKTTGSVK